MKPGGLVKVAFLLGVGLLSGLVGAAPPQSQNPGTQQPSPTVARELLSSVCKTGAASGTCTPCPAFTPDAQAGYSGGKFVPISVLYGKFTDPKRTDALMDMSGCEPHADNYGGSLLLRWQGLTSWKQTRYLSGYRTGQCLKYPAQGGRELLLCQGDFYNMGVAAQNLILLDVRRAEPLTQILLSTEDSLEACLKRGSAQSLLGWKALPGDRYPGLRITLRSASYIRPHQGKLPDDLCAAPLRATPSRVYTLDYRYNGVQFTLLPGSRLALAALKRDNPYLLGE